MDSSGAVLAKVAATPGATFSPAPPSLSRSVSSLEELPISVSPEITAPIPAPVPVNSTVTVTPDADNQFLDERFDEVARAIADGILATVWSGA